MLKKLLAIVAVGALIALPACDEANDTDNDVENGINGPENFSLQAEHSEEGVTASIYTHPGTPTEAMNDFGVWAQDEGWTVFEGEVDPEAVPEGIVTWAEQQGWSEESEILAAGIFEKGDQLMGAFMQVGGSTTGLVVQGDKDDLGIPENDEHDRTGMEGFTQVTSHTEDGVTGTLYSYVGTVSEAVEQLSTWLEDQGWTPAEVPFGDIYVPVDLEGMGLDAAVYEKDGQLKGIAAAEMPVVGTTNAVIVEGAYDDVFRPDDNDNDENDVPMPPTEDAEGEDIDDVPRPVGNDVRLDSSSTVIPGMALYEALYITDEDLVTVGEWYENELPDHGWVFLVKEEDADQFNMQWTTPDESTVLFVMCSPSGDYEGYTEVEVEKVVTS